MVVSVHRMYKVKTLKNEHRYEWAQTSKGRTTHFASHYISIESISWLF